MSFAQFGRGARKYFAAAPVTVSARVPSDRPRASSADASPSRARSVPARPASWTPTGMPSSAERPAGTDTAASRARLATTDQQSV